MTFCFPIKNKADGLLYWKFERIPISNLATIYTLRNLPGTDFYFRLHFKILKILIDLCKAPNYRSSEPGAPFQASLNIHFTTL